MKREMKEGVIYAILNEGKLYPVEDIFEIVTKTSRHDWSPTERGQILDILESLGAEIITLDKRPDDWAPEPPEPWTNHSWRDFEHKVMTHSDEQLQKEFELIEPTGIDMADPETFEIAQMIKQGMAEGTMYKAKPGVYKMTRKGVEVFKQRILAGMHRPTNGVQ